MPEPPRRRPSPPARKPAARRSPAPRPKAEKPERAKPKPTSKTKPNAKATSKPGATSKPAGAAKPPLQAVKGSRTEDSPDPARRRAVMWGALLSVVFVGVLFAFVYPTQTFLDQRDATNSARRQLDVLRSESSKLADAAKRLESDEEIARLAREKYGLVKPGEIPFVILPAPSTTAPPPPAETPKPTP